MHHFTLIIPVYHPMKRFVPYVEEAVSLGIQDIIIVDDGNDAIYDPIFAQLSQMPEVTLLHHDLNRGKGAALKTAFKYILKERRDIKGVVTADADGQHLLIDVVRIGDRLLNEKLDMLIGMRDMTAMHVPLRSKIGNTLSTHLFKLLFGVYFEDTQTGLRGMNVRQFTWLSELEGDHFDYELNMLIAMVRKKLNYKTDIITTVYMDEHFSNYATFTDTWRIAKALFRGYFYLT